MTSFDIAIVGGGPAGATAAALLAGRGLCIAVCESKTFPRHKVCGELLSATAFPVLERLGLLQDFHAIAGPPIRHATIFPSAGPCVEVSVPPGPCGAFPRALSRAAFDELLLRRAADAGATVFQRTHVASLTGSIANGFTLGTHDGTALSARRVVLAHGLPHSALNPAPTKRTPQSPRNTYVCFKAHFTHCALADDTIALAGAPGAYAGLVRTALPAFPTTNSGHHSSQAVFVLAFVVRRSDVARLGPSPEEHLAALLRANPTFGRVFRHARPRTPWLASGPLVPGLRTLYHEGRFAIGNAAAELHPLLGEGMALALHSATHAADVLERHIGRASAGDDCSAEHAELAAEYAARFRAEFTPRHRASCLLAALITRPLLSHVSAALVNEVPPLLALLANIMKPATCPLPEPPAGQRTNRWPGTQNEPLLVP